MNLRGLKKMFKVEITPLLLNALKLHLKLINFQKPEITFPKKLKLRGYAPLSHLRGGGLILHPPLAESPMKTKKRVKITMQCML
jgi:hypothetical protein